MAFVEFLKENFPKSNRLHKVFKKTTLKVSYSCMSNIASIISSHNKRLINLEPLCMVATTEREKTGRCKLESCNDYNIPI